ncbi:cytosolic endo-beta-N-acetylglucosaminidase [Drosophila busckii]|uniref:cytosolic endo-beta-N-acetylglucosaminidase n=1 Tax=Drosophila busckii TaxID=30019 RepID=UPI0014329503|nr:cytosolic endo-beta-N-acetylglucosaminidase [Drosophila busckii]
MARGSGGIRMGNYLADKHFQSSEKYDDYRFVHWSAVDYFCYFSHSYVTIPPSGWINAAHRHGVPVLGTYIVEGDTLLNEVLASPDSVERAVAALTRLCLHFQFEGWLVNVECAVRPTAMNNLYLFVEKLRLATETQVPHGRVFWYDSVIDSGQLNWQNELNERNVQFFRRSHAMLINYSWNDRSLETSAAVMEEEQAAGQRLFMGLDVFGRGQLAKFQSAQTLSRIARRGFSAGIFAPGWCFETLSRFGYNIHNTQGDESVNAAFLARNERWWSRLWPWLGTHAYRKLPFYTDFCVGSGRSSYQCGARSDERGFFNLARQALQPSVPLDGNAEHSFDVAFAGGCALRMLNYERAFRLFLTQFELPLGVLLLGYAHKLEDHAMDIVLRCSVPGKQAQDLYLFCGAYAAPILTPGLCYMPPLATATLAPQLQHVQLAGQLTDNWQVRYYLIRFDGPVQLLDIGVKCRRPAESSASSYLGAIYVQRLQLTDWQAAAATMGKVELPAYQTQLWNAAPAPQAAAAE